MKIISCPECNACGGWHDLDGGWIICELCEGEREIEDEDADED